MRLEIELRCILFPLIILEMFLQLDWNPVVVNEIDWTWLGKARTCLYIWHAQLTVQKKNSSEVERIVRRILSRHRSGEYQKMSAVLKVPKNIVTSIILKWKKFGATKPLSRAGRLAKLSNQGSGPWSGRWPSTQWSLWQSSRVPLWRWENLPEGQPSLQHSTNQTFMVEWTDGSHSSEKDTWQPAWSLPKGT